MTFDQIIQVFNTVGIWLAAIATFSAVWVSLHLANRAGRVKLKAFVGIWQMFGGGPYTKQGEHLYLNITNYGKRSVVVTSIGWSTGKGRSKNYWASTGWSAGSAKIPTRLQDGESAAFLLSLEETDWINRNAKEFCKQHDIKTLRCLIGTSLGTTTEIIPAKPLLNRLAEAAKSTDNKSA